MKILIASSISPDAIEKLRESHDVICAFDVDSKLLGKLLADREALVFRSGVEINREILRNAPNPVCWFGQGRALTTWISIT